MTRFQRILSIALAAVSLPFVASSQVATGLPPFGSFGAGPFDTLNNANLNVHMEVPVFSRTGRGTNFSYSLGYDSAVWSPVGGVWSPAANWGWPASRKCKPATSPIPPAAALAPSIPIPPIPGPCGETLCITTYSAPPTRFPVSTSPTGCLARGIAGPSPIIPAEAPSMDRDIRSTSAFPEARISSASWRGPVSPSMLR